MKLASLGLHIPEGLGQQEVVVLELSRVVALGDVEEGRPSVEVVVHSVSLGGGSPPGRVVSVGEEGVTLVGPGVLKALDGVEVVLLAHGDHKVLILDGPAVAEGDLATVGVDFLDADCIRVGDVLADEGPGGGCEVELGDSGCCLLYTSPSPRDATLSRMPSSA